MAWIDDGIAGPPTPVEPEALPAADADSASMSTAVGSDQGAGDDIGSGVRFEPTPAGDKVGIIQRIEALWPPAADGSGKDALSGMLMAMGVGIIVMVLLRRLRTKARKRAPVAEPRERIDELQADAQKRARAEDVTSDVEEIARRFAAVLDDKAMRLELLIAEADRRLGAVGPAGASGAAPLHGSAHDRPTAPARSDGGFEPASESDHGGVYELADDGLDPVAIAQKLGKPIGEVELILALRAS